MRQVCVGLSFLAFFYSLSSFAFTDYLLTNGNILKHHGAPKINLAGNPSNSCGLSESAVFNAVVRGLQKWQDASGGTTQFDYWQGASSEYERNSDYNGLSSFYFASQHSRQSPPTTYGVMALTQIWYDTSNGKILETDTILNDIHYLFTTNPLDSAGTGAGRYPSPGGRPTVFIENVITHEFGHSYGVGHDASLQSTMLFVEGSEQAYLSCDDQLGIRAKYPGPYASTSIRGSVRTQSGQVVPQAHVLAISKRRGTILTSAMTNGSGDYTLYSLEPGSYYLAVEPYRATTQSLPPFYQSLTPVQCSSGTIGRSFLTQNNSNQLVEISVESGQEVNAPYIIAKCSSQGGATITGPTGGTAFASAFDWDLNTQSHGIADRFQYAGQSLYYRIKNFSGVLEIRGLAYSLFSPIKLQLELYDEANRLVSVQKAEPVYFGSSGFANYDSALIAQNLPLGNYTVKVSGQTLSYLYYPAGQYFLDTVPFFTLIALKNPSSQPPYSANLPFNARCRRTENYGSYQSPPGGPIRTGGSSGSQKKERRSTGFCGTIAQNMDPPPPFGLGEMIGWFIPYLMIAFMLQKKRLLRLLQAPVTLKV